MMADQAPILPPSEPNLETFAAEAVQGGKVVGFSRNGIAFVFQNQDLSAAALPFWSSRERAEPIPRSDAEFADFEFREIDLVAFMRWLVRLETGGNLIGLNWSTRMFAKHYHAAPRAGVGKDSVPAGELLHAIQRKLE